MKEKMLKVILSMLMVLNIAAPFSQPLLANQGFVIVDDNVTSSSEENYFTYSQDVDPSGEKGWSNTDSKNFGENELKTQHWVWFNNNTEASKHFYTFTFVGTGVELVGITPTGSDNNTFQLDEEQPQTLPINTSSTKQESVLYSRKNLPYGKHTVKVTLPNDGKQTGLQISYARVYGSTQSEVEKTVIPHTQTTGTTNKFTFSETGWTAGNNEHVWSETPPADNPGSVWYEVAFIGHKIEVYAGKNRPMGKVKYFIDGVEQGTYSLYNGSNINSALIATFDQLSEGPHTFKAVATGEKDTGSTSTLIDCSKVVVYHKPYNVSDITLDSSQYTLIEGASQQITFTTTPDYIGKVEATYQSANEQVASVDQNGLITAKGAGTTTITVSLPQYSISKTVTVQVVEGIADLGGSIVDIDSQYTQDRFDEVVKMGLLSQELSAWKNDKVLSEIALVNKGKSLKNVTITAEDLKNGNEVISKDHIVATFIKPNKAYVGPFLGYGSTTRPVPEDNGSNRQESSDILYQTTPMDLKTHTVQPIWVSFNIPKDAKPGVYTSKIKVTADGLDQPLTFEYKINVKDVTLKDATEFKNSFDIELWQYPYSSAEYYDVVPFSEEHFKILTSIMELYKSIGGHAITATIIEDAWSGQTYSKNEIHYPSMIKWEMKNGVMTYDYTDFDKWVQFNKNLGIGDKIILYSIAPWHNSFTYWENGTLVKKGFRPGSDEYKKMWTHFLKDLISHLENKGWFNDCYIGIDERGFNSAAFDVIESVTNSKGESLKTAGAMSYGHHPQLAMRVDDVNVGDDTVVNDPKGFEAFVEERKQKGLRTTLYSCTGHHPGNFSLSAPVESYWSIIHAGEKTQGFLRWAYDAWVEDPLRDATHNAFEPGDCFLVYPDEKDAVNPTAKSSVRLERMAQGVRDVNKLRQMSEQFPRLKADIEKMYQKITTKQVIKLSYLTEEEYNTLAKEMNTFMRDLDALTDQYIALRDHGTNNITNLQIQEGDITLSLGNSKQLHVIFEPENVINIDVDWNSSNEKVVSVDKAGVITAKGLGQAQIEAVSKQDPTKKAQITVTTAMAQIEKEAQKAYYSFDGKNAHDEWGNRDGIVNNAGFAAGKSGQALYIDHPDKGVSFNTPSGINENDPWTISYWVKATCPINNRISVFMDAAQSYSLDMKLSSRGSAGYHMGKKDSDVLTFGYTFKKDTWYNITWTQSKTDGLSMYVDGTLVGTNAWSKTNKTILPFDLMGGTGFTGYIDDVKVYNRVLNNEEIQSQMLLKGLNISVKEKTLDLNDKFVIDLNLITDEADKTITYTSTNPEIASVDANGVVTAHKYGECKIIVEHKAGNYRDEVSILVKKILPIKNTLPTYELPEKYLSDIEKHPEVGHPRRYLGHPDMVKTKSNKLITAYGVGHGVGETVMQISNDYGETWTEKTDKPTSWLKSKETPTLYTLDFKDGSQKIIMISGCPSTGGWNTSLSSDDGNTWSEYKLWHQKHSNGSVNGTLVAMASLVHLKDADGNYMDKWMAVYHNGAFNNYKTYLTFDENGNEQWSAPERYLEEYNDIEKKYQICEVGLFRSPDGKRIVALARSQSHNNPSTMFYSDDEGNTWSKPVDLPGSLAGERHKGAYDPISGRLLITFREIAYDQNNNGKFDGANDWMAGDWVAWVGTYEDLMAQNEGEYRILLDEDWANNRYSGDTGYAGVVVLNDGTFIMNSYGHWDKEVSQNHTGSVLKDLCYIKQAKFKLSELEKDHGFVDKTPLKNAIKDAEEKAKDKELYVDFSGVESALKNANDILNKKDVTEAEVTNAIKALEDAMGALCLKKADYSAVEAAVAKAKALNPKDYVDFSGVEKALQAVIYDLDITKQAEVDEYAKAINLAIESLEKKPVEPENPVNKEDLQEAVDKASKLDQKNYTEESWKSFEEAYAHAKDVLGNQNATKEEVAKAKDTLNEAIQQLKPVETKPVLPVDPKPEAPQDPEGEAPNTGDETHVFQYVTLLAISSLLLAGFVMMKRRRVVKK